MIFRALKDFFYGQRIECDICHQLFQESNIASIESHKFCIDHYRYFRTTKWTRLITVNCHNSSPEQGVELYQFHLDLYHKHQIPSVIHSSYTHSSSDKIITIQHLDVPVDFGPIALELAHNRGFS